MKKEKSFHELIEEQNPERKAAGLERLHKLLEEEKRRTASWKNQENAKNRKSIYYVI